MYRGRYYGVLNNSEAHLPLRNELRKLWSQHVYWTRMFVISSLNELSDLDAVTSRLLRNPKDFAAILRRYYGIEKANAFEKLLTEHLTIAAKLVQEAKEGNTVLMNETKKPWYKNADEIAKFMADANPNWSENEWRNMMYTHLMLLESQIAQSLNKQYGSSVNNFDEIENQALMMADEMSKGIIKQFQL